MTVADWTPQSLEDELLRAYWLQVGGRLYLEVPIGGPGGPGDWPPGSKIRRIDCVRVGRADAQREGIVRFSDCREEFGKVIGHGPVELIEAKKKLNRLVIGQVIAGADMFKRQYRLDQFDTVIVCEEGDPALEWVCHQRGILVRIIPSRKRQSA